MVYGTVFKLSTSVIKLNKHFRGTATNELKRLANILRTCKLDIGKVLYLRKESASGDDTLSYWV